MRETRTRIWRVDDIECRAENWDWSFVQERREDIARHWAGLVAERPSLFDGRVLMAHCVETVSTGDRSCLRSAWFETGFSAFLAWRDFGFPDRQVRNGFAMAALQGSDGGYVLARMGPHTANPDRIYFACGTPDLSDLRGTCLDLEGSVLRELEEETGLRPDEVALDPGWTMVETGGRLAFMKTVRLDVPADEIVREVEARLARQDDPELAGMHAVRSREDLRPSQMPDFILDYLDVVLPADAGAQPPG